MAIEDIETYDELDEYCKEKGYENLTDEDIKNLKNKVWEINRAKEERIQEKEMNPHARIALIMIERSAAASRCHFLDNCTEERKRRNIIRRLEEADRRAGGIIPDDFGLTDEEIDMDRRLH